MATQKSDPLPTMIKIPDLNVGSLELCIIGTSPFLCNRMSEKAKRSLLLPAGRKTAVEKQSSLKHDPLEEFRAAPYTLPEPEPTLIGLHAASLKRAMAAAALDVAGANKAQIGRLCRVEATYSNYVPLYGVPELLMTVVRMADQNHTPDVRSFPIVPRWATRFQIQYVQPQLTETAVVNLLATAGFTIGVGDGRPEKGKLNYGTFRVTSSTDPEYQEIVEAGGRAEQIAAMEAAIPYDRETEELLGWYVEEVDRRGRGAFGTTGVKAGTEANGAELDGKSTRTRRKVSVK